MLRGAAPSDTRMTLPSIDGMTHGLDAHRIDRPRTPSARDVTHAACAHLGLIRTMYLLAYAALQRSTELVRRLVSAPSYQHDRRALAADLLRSQGSATRPLELRECGSRRPKIEQEPQRTWDIPPAWTGQLAHDGVLVVPLRMRGNTRSVALTREGDHLAATSAILCGFVPMQGAGGQPEHRLQLRSDAIVPAHRRRHHQHRHGNARRRVRPAASGRVVPGDDSTRGSLRLTAPMDRRPTAALWAARR
jgi:hypothetical protein